LLAAATLVLFLAACPGPAQSIATTSAAATQGVILPVTSVSEQDELAGQHRSGEGLKSYLIKVYFSKFDSSEVSAVFAVNRFSPTLAVATFAVQSLIAGPTLAESDAGYFTELNSFFAGPSTCKGFRDFSLSLNKKGTTPEQRTVTVQFCRPLFSPGEGADGQGLAEIQATMKQFSNIKKVVVLLQNGHCFGDESGQDLCLK
jgi:hypothetical protein